MNDRQTDVKHKFQNRSARMLPLSAQQHDNGISATGVPTTLLLSSFKVLQVHWNCKAWRSGCPGRLPWLLHSSWALSTSSSFTVLLIHKNCKAWRSGCPGRPGRPPWLSHSSWALSPLHENLWHQFQPAARMLLKSLDNLQCMPAFMQRTGVSA